MLHGFPPTEISQPANTPISSVLKNGDTITIEKRAVPIPEPAPTNLPVVTLPQPKSSLPLFAPGSGNFVVRKIPDDNSCLFTAIGYTLESKSRTSASRIRTAVVDLITQNPSEYTDAVLNKPRDDYIKWIGSANACTQQAFLK